MSLNKKNSSAPPPLDKIQVLAESALTSWQAQIAAALSASAAAGQERFK